MDNIKIVREQRKMVIIATSILIIVGSVVNLLGLTGHQGRLFMTINLIYISAVVISLCTILFKKDPPLLYIIIGLLMSVELVICTENVICAYDNIQYSILIIIANMTILSTIILMSLLAYLHYTTYIFAAMTIISYTICVYITDNEELWGLYLLFVLLFGTAALLGSMLSRGINSIFQDNIKIKTDLSASLDAMGLNEADFIAHLELAKESKIGDRSALDILNVMGKRAQEVLKKNVSYLVEQDQIMYGDIHLLIPEFTPSEVDIAKLVVEGKKLSEMTLILNKKKGNITCQRSKMRVKLKLNEKDILKDAILKRLVSASK